MPIIDSETKRTRNQKYQEKVACERAEGKDAIATLNNLRAAIRGAVSQGRIPKWVYVAGNAEQTMDNFEAWLNGQLSLFG